MKRKRFALVGYTIVALIVAPIYVIRSDASDQITLCHSTGPDTYSKITVSSPAAALGHDSHAADIIPAFHDDDVSYPGKNLDKGSILANDCNVPPPTSTTTTSTTTTSTTTTSTTTTSTTTTSTTTTSTTTTSTTRPVTHLGAPTPPTMENASSGPTSGLVSFGRPVSEGASSITTYTVTCASSNGGKPGSASGTFSPLVVSGLTTGSTYTCTATATNGQGTSAPSGVSNEFAPSATASCTDEQICHAQLPAPASSKTPLQTVAVDGTPSDPIGTVELSVASASMDCPNVAPGPRPITTLDNSGFDATTRLQLTMTLHFTTSTAREEVCFDSIRPFRNQSSPSIPTLGPALLLDCSDVANVAPCVLSSTQVGRNIVVKFVVPGGDPRFYLVLPKGRQVWLSRFPPGKVGARYSAQLQSSGGKAPVRWKVTSGKLPGGLTVNTSTGAISGTPTTKGNFTVVVRATDSETPPKIAQMSVPITIK